MSFYSYSEVRDRIETLVSTVLEEKGLPVTAAAGASLSEAGLASMDMVNLMLGIEAAFDFMIPQADITPETFRSVDTIATMLVRHFPQAEAA